MYNFSDYFLEFMYIAIGFLFVYNAYGITKNKENENRAVTSTFWLILGLIFIFSNINIFFGQEEPFISYTIIGYLVVILSLLSLSKKITLGKYQKVSDDTRAIAAQKIGGKIFIPAALIGVLGFAFYGIQQLSFYPEALKFGDLGALGMAILVSAVVGLAITKERPLNAINEGRSLLDQVGPMSILPQVLAALGSLFTAAGVGNYISAQATHVIPDGNIFIAIIVYCLSMAIFTIIMGNAFAAFTVITVGIAIPFLIIPGGNPAVIGALGMTAGFCGTLLTPMGANFNIVPTSILEMEDRKWGIIKYQAPMALILLAIHVLLMYVLAF